MAITYAYAGQLQIVPSASATASGDAGGSITMPQAPVTIAYAAAGGTAPTVSGFLYGTLTFPDGNPAAILLAHATDPLQTLGDATYSPGFTVASSKLKTLIIKNTSTSTQTLKVERTTTVGLPIFDTQNDSVTLGPDGLFVWHVKGGTAALTTGANDSLTLTPSTTGVTGTIWAYYGP